MIIHKIAGFKELTIFDLDGTLLDYRTEEETAISHVCRLLYSERAVDPAEVRNVYTAAKREARQRVAPSGGQLCARFDSLVRGLDLPQSLSAYLLKEYISARVHACRPYPDATQIITSFCAYSYRAAVLTNGACQLQRSRLTAAGLYNLFSAIYSSEEIGWTKPDRRAFDFVLCECGSAYDRCRVVGDDPTADLREPARHGADTWLVDRTEQCVRRWQ